jgi:hypothetical protein
LGAARKAVLVPLVSKVAVMAGVDAEGWRLRPLMLPQNGPRLRPFRCCAALLPRKSESDRIIFERSVTWSCVGGGTDQRLSGRRGASPGRREAIIWETCVTPGRDWFAALSFAGLQAAISED